MTQDHRGIGRLGDGLISLLLVLGIEWAEIAGYSKSINGVFE